MESGDNIVVDMDRLKLREERALRRKEKKVVQMLVKRKEKEEKELQFKIQPVGGNINLITQDFANKFSEQNLNTLSVRYETNVPLLSKLCRTPKKEVLSLGDFLNDSSVTHKPVKTQPYIKYSGNPLDSDLPVRKRGKQRETPKIKRPSALKRDILKDKPTYNTKYTLKDMFPNVTVIEDVNNSVSIFISRVVELQEKLFKRDHIKGTHKRRYVVGLHEAQKYLKLKKAKIIIIAYDIEFIKEDDAMSTVIKEIMETSKKNNAELMFALKRRTIGTLTMKHIPVSCIVILNYEGAEKGDVQIQSQPVAREDIEVEQLRNQLEGKSALDLFFMYFDEEVIDAIVAYSIKYAQDHNRHEFDFNHDDLLNFIGILILSGYHTLPQPQLYWSTDEDKGLDITKNCMSRNKFNSIKRNTFIRQQ
ncbi:hypothetical protein FQA39_LY13189 [Lamprigera yunnana]|nr:hypothetical protein FQA39_LY13189 [Lamprigera yunnana]